MIIRLPPPALILLKDKWQDQRMWLPFQVDHVIVGFIMNHGMCVFLIHCYTVLSFYRTWDVPEIFLRLTQASLSHKDMLL